MNKERRTKTVGNLQLTQRQINIIRRMADGTGYFSQSSPRMTQKEAEELWGMGFLIQTESVHGADRSAGLYFSPLPALVSRAKEYGIV